VDLDTHLTRKNLGAVLKRSAVLRLPAEAVLQKAKSAWVMNQLPQHAQMAGVEHCQKSLQAMWGHTRAWEPKGKG